MKNFWKKVSGAVWLQVIAVSCVLFLVNIAAATSLERVDSGSNQLAGTSGQTESSDSLNLDDQSFNESGAFGDWENFSDFYEESQSVRPDSTPSREPSSESSSESASEPSSEPSSESSSESSSEPGVIVTPSESSEESPAPPSEPSSEVPPTSVPGDSPMDAPSHTTEPPVSSQQTDESVPPAQ